jgi:hypothetical protein
MGEDKGEGEKGEGLSIWIEFSIYILGAIKPSSWLAGKLSSW